MGYSYGSTWHHLTKMLYSTFKDRWYVALNVVLHDWGGGGGGGQMCK